VAEVMAVAAVDIDELVSFRTGGEAPSGCKPCSSCVVFVAVRLSGLGEMRRCTERGSSLLLGDAPANLMVECILWLARAEISTQMQQNPMVDE
jgi:hypothetical protein